jgi:hypothetical protein
MDGQTDTCDPQCVPGDAHDPKVAKDLAELLFQPHARLRHRLQQICAAQQHHAHRRPGGVAADGSLSVCPWRQRSRARCARLVADTAAACRADGHGAVSGAAAAAAVWRSPLAVGRFGDLNKTDGPDPDTTITTRCGDLNKTDRSDPDATITTRLRDLNTDRPDPDATICSSSLPV